MKSLFWCLALVFALQVQAVESQTLSTSEQAESEALSMAMQVVDQLNNYVTKGQLSSIHNEDLIVSSAISGLRLHPVTETNSAVYKETLVSFGLAVSRLHSAADAGEQSRALGEMENVRRSFESLKPYFSTNALAVASSRAERFTCPMHPVIRGKRIDLCPQCGMDLDQQVRVLPKYIAEQSRSSTRANISTKEPLQAGKRADAILTLKHANGMPVLLTDLIEAHTEKIHLLIIEPSLKDYHHEHPRPTAVPGEYAFSFTPTKAGSYRAWADIRPGPLGLQEYARCDIESPARSAVLDDKAIVTNTVVQGLNFTLFIPSRIRVGKSVPARLRVTFADGNDFTRLEPVMGTFAHLVGFYEDYETVLHMHPKGPAITTPGKFGGPDLEFQIYTLQLGFVRLFAQVQIAGRQIFAPFSMRIEKE